MTKMTTSTATTTATATRYKLSQQLVTDTNPIRSISYNNTSSKLYTGSESGIVSTIHLPTNDVQIFGGSGNDNDDSATATAATATVIASELVHDHHITALVSNETVYVTGCKDALIRVFDRETNKRLFVLKGHDKPVTSLSFLDFGSDAATGSTATVSTATVSTAAGYLISGSWDGTAKIWNLNSGQCCATVDGHENTVSVQGLPPPSSSSSSSSTAVEQGQVKARFATGSAGIATGNMISDHKIRIYEVSTSTNNESMAVLLKSTIANDHQGPIRSLSYDNKLQLLLSCSNDGSVKLRDIQTGSCIQTLSFPMTYEESQADDNDDDDFKIEFSLKDQEPPMLLDVCTNHNNTIVACGEDGTVIIWSTNSDTTITTQIIPHPNCVWKILVLPNNDVVTACHDGKIRIFTKDIERMGSKEEILSFYDEIKNMKQSKSNGPSEDEIQKLPKWEMNYTINGKGEGSVQVFNKGGRAIAAQWSDASKTWIEVGEVTGQVGGDSNSSSSGTIHGTKFDFVFPIEIDVPGGGLQKLQIGYNNGENPFVTAQAFIDEHTLDQGYLAQIADYIRNRVGRDGYVPTIGAEEAGGGSGSGPSPMDCTPTPPPTYQHLPMKGYKSFENGADVKTLTKVSNKITEFNTAMNSNLSANEITTVLPSLVSTIVASNRYHATTISDAQLKIIHKMMSNWSLAHVFPAIDLARLVVLHPDASSMKRNGFWIEMICIAMDKCDALLQNLNSVEGPAKVAIPMLTLRLFANCIRGGPGSRSAVESHLPRILNCVEKFISSDNKNIRLAASTVLLNVSSDLKSTGNYVNEIPDLFLALVGKICANGSYETEAILRMSVALGTALLVDDVFVQKAKLLMLGSTIQNVARQHGDKATSISSEISSILS